MEKASEAPKWVYIATAAASHVRCACSRLATSFDEADIELNEGPGQIHQLVAASSMSIGTGDRVENEHEYLQKALERPKTKRKMETAMNS